MPNVDADRGFTPIGYQSGKPYSGAARRYYKSASVILGVGDPVIRTTNSTDPEGGPSITRATTGAAITGVIVGFEPKYSTLSQQGMLAADTGYVYVADDPDLLFEVQDNGGATGIVVADIGEHVNSVAAINASTVTGRSKYEIDTEAQATNNTWRIEALSRRPGNAVGANAKWIVSANLHTEVNASATTRTEI